MSRLTEKKVLDNFKAIKNISPNYVASNEELIYDKLGKLEDLEEEIGCPLDVVIKALKDGIYDIFPNGNMFLERSFTLKNYSTGWHLKKPKLEIPLENYKKTWWLKRDKSE